MAISRGFFGLPGLAGTALALVVATAPLPARAQDAPAPDKVVATVNGVPIKESDLALAEQDVGTQLQSVPEAARRDYLLRFMADLILGTQAAEEAKLQDSPDFAQRLQYFRNKILLDDLMVKEAAKADTPEARKKLYDENVAKLPPETELHARHILVDDEATAIKVAERAEKGEDFLALSRNSPRIRAPRPKAAISAGSPRTRW